MTFLFMSNKIKSLILKIAATTIDDELQLLMRNHDCINSVMDKGFTRI